MDNLVYLKLRFWARRRHPEKNQHWIAHKYWLIGSSEGWSFASRNAQNSVRLFKHAQTPIKQHVKVQGKRGPYDGDWVYWSNRMGYHPTVTSTVAKLLKKQTGQCTHCGLNFFQMTVWRFTMWIGTEIITDEIIWPYSIDITTTKSMRSMYNKHQAVEEPREGTTFKHGFEDQQGG